MDAHEGYAQELAESLFRVRKDAGLTQVELGARTGLDQARISHVEKGRRLFSRDQVEAIARACGCDDDETGRLTAMATAVNREYGDARIIIQRGAISNQEKIRKLERDTSRIREFQPTQVAGVCQTEAYIRAVFSQTPGKYSPETLDGLVRQRVARGREVAASPSPTWQIVHTEGAFGWALGGPMVMAEQMDRLVEMSRLPHIRMGVVPFGRPVDFTAHHGWTIFDSTAALVGTVTGPSTARDPADVEEYAEKFRRLLTAAVFDDEAREHLARISRRYQEEA